MAAGRDARSRGGGLLAGQAAADDVDFESGFLCDLYRSADRFPNQGGHHHSTAFDVNHYSSRRWCQAGLRLRSCCQRGWTRLRNRCEAALRSAKSGQEFRQVLEQTIEESEGLIRTFDALLMIARAESGEVRDGMAEFDAAEVARDVSELYEPLAEDKGLTLEVDVKQHAAVKGNRELVSQALANLVDNAIKYAAPAEKAAGAVNGASGIRVTAEAEPDQIVLTVSDHGPGIPTADRSRVLDRFVRLEQSRSQPGSGLGLSLVSAVARLHGGELKLEDNAPGLRARIMLPRAAVPPQRAA